MGCSNANNVDSLCIVQGEDETLEITVFTALGTTYDLTGVKLYFTVRANWRDADTVIAKATANAGGSDLQISVLAQSGATKGKAQIYITAADTVNLTNEQVAEANNYVYDIWLVTVANKHKVIRRMSNFEILSRVSHVP